MTKIKAYWQGFKDGFESPECLSSGMTYPDDNLNEMYDRGVNFGQVVGSWIKWTTREKA